MEKLKPTDKKYEAMELIIGELSYAEKKHPEWPNDIFRAVAIINGKAGESIQAALDYHYDGGSMDDLVKELAKTGAMCIRAMINIGNYNPPIEIKNG